MGDAFTGNTTMLLEEGLDTGPILLQQTIEIAPEQTAVGLFDILAHAGAPWWLKPSPAWPMEPSILSRKTTPSPPLPAPRS